jgi:hypothetical protein
MSRRAAGAITKSVPKPKRSSGCGSRTQPSAPISCVYSLPPAAYVGMQALRRVGLGGTALARACTNTIWLKLLMIGAVVTVSVRRVKLAMSEACANQRKSITAFHKLSAAAR